MANPKFISCPKNVWKKVADNQVSGQIWKTSSAPRTYLQTYREHGNSAPVDSSEGVSVFVENNYAEIKSSSPVDVYIMALNKNGRVRVDI